MTDAEQKTALRLFKKVIDANAVQVDRNHADPIQQNCYISSGSVEGIFFPNSVIKYCDRYFDFVAVVKNENNALGICSEYKEDAPHILPKNEYCFTSFDSLLYTKDELTIIEELKKRIKYAENDIKVLSAIRFTTKKTGEPFADLKKNIEEHPAENLRVYARYNNYNDDTLIISLTETKTSQNGVIYNNYSNDIYFYNCKTVDDVKSYIEKLTKTRTEEIAQYKKDIANVKKITVAVNKFLESIAGYKGMHYEMRVDCNGFIWRVQSTDFTPVGADVGLRITPEDIHIMHRTVYGGDKA